MAEIEYRTRKNRFLRRLDSELTAFIVLVYGLLIIFVTLLVFIAGHRFRRLVGLDVDLPLFIGLSLIYLSVLIRRLKRTAWLATILAFAMYIGISIDTLSDYSQSGRHITIILIARLIILPLLIITLLLINHKRYVVRSDIQGFRSAATISLIVLAVTFIYGTVGFSVLGKRDFHQSLTIPAAMHYTVDQFNVTTNHPIYAYTKRAKLFQDSLGVISTVAVIYVLVSLFQPLRYRFSDQTNARSLFKQLLEKQHDSRSEDFFKLWPLDKQYFFDSSRSAGLAFRVYRGTALILGDPNGKRARFRQLLGEFQYVCSGNDWHPALIHCQEENRELYETMGYTMQKLGQEAVVNLEHFNKEVADNKYFRNISNKFNKTDYSFEMLSPPHSSEVMARLKQISDEWLSQGNRTERGFALGFYNEAYLNNCRIGLAMDSEGVIQAFINIVPAEFDPQEATYDLLRSSQEALSNANDFLLLNLARQLEHSGFSELNLGLCPLSGLGEDTSGKPNRLIDYFLSLAYHNGGRIYSFQGLSRFKNKYEPVWQDSYVAFQGGLAGFSKTMNAVMALMRQGAKHSSRRYIN